MYPGIVKNSDGDTSNVYLTIEYLNKLEQRVFPYLQEDTKNKSGKADDINKLAAEWVRLFGNKEGNKSDG